MVAEIGKIKYYTGYENFSAIKIFNNEQEAVLGELGGAWNFVHIGYIRMKALQRFISNYPKSIDELYSYFRRRFPHWTDCIGLPKTNLVKIVNRMCMSREDFLIVRTSEQEGRSTYQPARPSDLIRSAYSHVCMEDPPETPLRIVAKEEKQKAMKERYRTISMKSSNHRRVAKVLIEGGTCPICEEENKNLYASTKKKGLRACRGCAIALGHAFNKGRISFEMTNEVIYGTMKRLAENKNSRGKKRRRWSKKKN